jgi:hypothetical protein
MPNLLNNFLEWHTKEHPEFNPDAVSLPEKYDLLARWIADQLGRLEIAVAMLYDRGSRFGCGNKKAGRRTSTARKAWQQQHLNKS